MENITMIPNIAKSKYLFAIVVFLFDFSNLYIVTPIKTIGTMLRSCLVSVDFNTNNIKIVKLIKNNVTTNLLRVSNGKLVSVSKVFL
jgi:hypothetical protein